MTRHGKGGRREGGIDFGSYKNDTSGRAIGMNAQAAVGPALLKFRVNPVSEQASEHCALAGRRDMGWRDITC